MLHLDHREAVVLGPEEGVAGLRIEEGRVHLTATSRPRYEVDGVRHVTVQTGVLHPLPLELIHGVHPLVVVLVSVYLHVHPAVVEEVLQAVVLVLVAVPDGAVDTTVRLVVLAAAVHGPMSQGDDPGLLCAVFRQIRLLQVFHNPVVLSL